ncbi:MAG: MTH938/NDUFAF3 family protein [Pirellula sp.]
MQNNQKTAFSLGGMGILLSLVLAWITWEYLPISSQRWSLTIACAACGFGFSLACYWITTRLPDRSVWRYLCVLLFLIAVSAPLLSSLFPHISYARFGLTVYGVTPVPYLDITINRNGVLWFRPKTHWITSEELNALMTEDVEVVVVGIGWDSIAQLSDDAKALASTVDLRVLSTPLAFALYNQLRREGRIVVLLAHSTC